MFSTRSAGYIAMQLYNEVRLVFDSTIARDRAYTCLRVFQKSVEPIAAYRPPPVEKRYRLLYVFCYMVLYRCYKSVYMFYTCFIKVVYRFDWFYTGCIKVIIGVVQVCIGCIQMLIGFIQIDITFLEILCDFQRFSQIFIDCH